MKHIVLKVRRSSFVSNDLIKLGSRQAVKTLDFDSSMRRFESFLPSQIKACKFSYTLFYAKSKITLKNFFFTRLYAYNRVISVLDIGQREA